MALSTNNPLPLLQFPSELIDKILSYVELRDLIVNVRLTCKRLQSATHEFFPSKYLEPSVVEKLRAEYHAKQSRARPDYLHHFICFPRDVKQGWRDQLIYQKLCKINQGTDKQKVEQELLARALAFENNRIVILQDENLSTAMFGKDLNQARERAYKILNVINGITAMERSWAQPVLEVPDVAHYVNIPTLCITLLMMSYYSKKEVKDFIIGNAIFLRQSLLPLPSIHNQHKEDLVQIMQRADAHIQLKEVVSNSLSHMAILLVEDDLWQEMFYRTIGDCSFDDLLVHMGKSHIELALLVWSRLIKILSVLDPELDSLPSKLIQRLLQQVVPFYGFMEFKQWPSNFYFVYLGIMASFTFLVNQYIDSFAADEIANSEWTSDLVPTPMR